MQKRIVAVLALLPLLGACGGGGGDGGPPPPPPPPCRDLGYGTAPETLLGHWDYDLDGTPSNMWLYAGGTFVDQERNGTYPGFWGVDADGKITLVYSLTNECPPTGTRMTATGVTADSTTISGTIEFSPMPNLTGHPWSITRSE